MSAASVVNAIVVLLLVFLFDRRTKRLEQKIRALQAVVVWTQTGHCANMISIYRPHRVCQMLRLTTRDAEMIITGHMPDSVNYEDN